MVGEETCPDPAALAPGQALSERLWLAPVPWTGHLLWWSAGLCAAALIAAC